MRETVRLTPLPCWKHLPPALYSKRIAELVEEKFIRQPTVALAVSFDVGMGRGELF